MAPGPAIGGVGKPPSRLRLRDQGIWGPGAGATSRQHHAGPPPDPCCARGDGDHRETSCRVKAPSGCPFVLSHPLVESAQVHAALASSTIRCFTGTRDGELFTSTDNVSGDNTSGGSLAESVTRITLLAFRVAGATGRSPGASRGMAGMVEKVPVSQSRGT